METRYNQTPADSEIGHPLPSGAYRFGIQALISPCPGIIRNKKNNDTIMEFHPTRVLPESQIVMRVDRKTLDRGCALYCVFPCLFLLHCVDLK